MIWLALLIIVLTWGAAIVGAIWRGHWGRAALIGFAVVTGVILVAQRIGGPAPIGYGIAFGLSIVLAGAMVLLGSILMTIRWLGRRDETG